MGYYCAWGDAKMTYSSEEEGYENRISIIIERRASETYGEAPSAPAPLISDDTDRQFWAEDELSSSESRQRLTTRRKRRRSVSYRNRAANKSRSCVSHPSNSSSDSIHEEILPKVRRTRRHWFHPKTEKLQSGKASCSSTEKTICTVNTAISSEHQPSTSGSRLQSRETILSHVNYERANNASRNVKKGRAKKSRGPLKSK